MDAKNEPKSLCRDRIFTSQGGENIGKEGRTSNDQRSDAMNPNNPENQASDDNRSRQMNPEDKGDKEE